jgi:polysaccharide deacetylase 2 family uncharacterized protein YibQ
MPKKRLLKRKSALPLQPFIILLFLLLVLFSAVSLDYIAWKKGEKSFLFSFLLKKEKAPLVEETPEQIVMRNLTFLNVSPESVQKFRDKKGDLHIMVDLPLNKYRELEFLLQKEFKKVNVAILEKDEQEAKEKNYFLWKTERKRKERMTLLFSCPKEKIKEELPSEKKFKNKVAIIIDDMGYSLKAINDICSIKRPLTVSILPFSPLAQETAQIAHQNHLEVMLHLPLESINSQEGNDIEGIILSRMSEEETRQAVEADLAQLPHLSGVNNHMGSKITAEEHQMRIILENLKKRNLFFIDSRTTGRSIAYKLSQEFEIPSAYRDIFLDTENKTENKEDYIKRKLIELFHSAQKRGEAVGICHPTEETLRVLKENLGLLMDQYNIEPVFASQIVHYPHHSPAP